MGVTGLLPFLKKSTDQINVSQFAGMTAAIDAYVWLHRGVFACAEKIARGEQTTGYVHYGLKMLHMLLSHNIKPILVFDGRRLEAKSDTEKKRHDLRKQNRQKAEELLRAGRDNEARDFLRRSVDITHQMAVELIKAARKIGVDCIVAPHEADAQLAYLNIQGIAQVIITEDSDLILFGCSQILYKLDINGNGLLLRLDRLHLTLGRSLETQQALLTKLRQMCILSGCDYASSLPGVGLVKAKKFVMASSDPDFFRSIKRLPSFLNLRAKVDEEYVERVRFAELTFRRQLVFDPRSRRQLTLDGEEVNSDEPYSGEYLEPKTAENLAIGNVDPFTMQVVDNFNPDTLPPTSIWYKNYVPTKPKQEARTTAFVTTKGKEIIVETKKIIISKPEKELCLSPELIDQDLAAMYSTRTTQRTVAQSEIKSSVFDGLQTKEVVQSSYFAQETVETKTELLSPKNLFQKRNSSSVPDPQYLSPRKSTTPSKIFSMIDESPSKLEVDKSPLAKNPFAKKTTIDKSPKVNEYSLDSDITIVSSQNSKHEENVDTASNQFAKMHKLFDRIPINDITIEELDSPPQQLCGEEKVKEGTPLEQLYTTPEEGLSQRTDPASSQSSEVGSDLGLGSQLLDRFRFRRPLFKKSSQSDDTVDSQPEKIVPKSPILGKRKRNENKSPTKMETTSSYFNRFSSAPLTPTCTNTDTSVYSLSTGGRRNLASVFQWSSSQETRVEVRSSSLQGSSNSSKLSSTPRSVGLRKVTKLSHSQSSLLNFGFQKKKSM